MRGFPEPRKAIEPGLIEECGMGSLGASARRDDGANLISE